MVFQKVIIGAFMIVFMHTHTHTHTQTLTNSSEFRVFTSLQWSFNEECANDGVESTTTNKRTHMASHMSTSDDWSLA